MKAVKKDYNVEGLSKADLDLLKAGVNEKLAAREAAVQAIKEIRQAHVKKHMPKKRRTDIKKYKVLDVYDTREDIYRDYVYGVITADKEERLEELWDEREARRTENPYAEVNYQDDFTKCMDAAFSAVWGMFEDEAEDIREIDRLWRAGQAAAQVETSRRREEARRLFS